MNKQFQKNQFDKEIIVQGRENAYKIRQEFPKTRVFISYNKKDNWTLDDTFDSFDGAIFYLNSCLAYESDGKVILNDCRTANNL